MLRFIGYSVIFCMVFGYSAPALANSFSGPDQEIGGGYQEKEEVAESEKTFSPDSDSWMSCHQLGKQDGENISTGGSVAAGLAGGVLLGLIGTGLVVLLQSDSEPSQLAMNNLEGDDCRYAYIEAYENKSLSKKRSSALIGGLIGTALFVAVYLSTSE
jgi:hypothetical protein